MWVPSFPAPWLTWFCLSNDCRTPIKVTGYTHEGLFLDLFYSLGLYCCLYANTTLFSLLQLYTKFWNWEGWNLQTLLIFLKTVWLVQVLETLRKLQEGFFCIRKKGCWDSGNDCMDSGESAGQCFILTIKPSGLSVSGLSLYLWLLQLLSAVVCSLQYTGCLPHWYFFLFLILT